MAKAEAQKIEPNFIFEQPRCPACGGAAWSILERVEIKMQLDRNEDDTYTYYGADTDILWDTMEPVVENERYYLTCRDCAQDWQTRLAAAPTLPPKEFVSDIESD